MGSPSKENQILEMIFENSPLKHWHFEEFIRETKISRAIVNKWIKKYDYLLTMILINAILRLQNQKWIWF